MTISRLAEERKTRRVERISVCMVGEMASMNTTTEINSIGSDQKEGKSLSYL